MTSSLPSARSAATGATPVTTLRPASGTVDLGEPRGRNPSHPSGLVARVGAWCYDHRKAAVGLWFAALIVVLGAAGGIGAAYDASPDIPDSESADGFDVLEQYFAELGAGGGSGTIVFRADQGVDDPAVVAAMDELFATVNAGFPDEDGNPLHPGATVVSPYSDQGESQIARQGPLAGQLAYAQVNLAADVGLTESAALGEAISDAAPTVEGLEVLPGGTALAVFETPKTEFIGLAFAIVVLILAFGSVLAMGLPIAVALGGVGAGLGLIVILSNVFKIPDFTTFLGAMIGLGVGIDYALFIVTRYREGLHAGRAPREATITAMDTAGRAVVFAGITVVISLLGLLLIGIGWVGGLGIGVAVTVLCTMITSIILLPALLGFAGERVEVTRWRGLIAAGFVAVAVFGVGIGAVTLTAVGAGLAALTMLVSFAVRPLRQVVPHRAPKPVRQTLAYRWSRTIQHRPWRWVVAGTAFLLVLAAPVLGLRLGFSDEGNLAEDTYTRQAYDLLADGFGPGFNGPFTITIVAGDGDSTAAVDTLHRALADTPGVAAVTPAFPNRAASPQAYLINLVPTTAPQDAATTELVTTLRDDVIPAAIAGTTLDVKVTGTAAANIDFTDFLARRISDLLRRCVGVVVPAPDGRLPVTARAAQGCRHEHPVDRRHLRRPRRHLPVGLGCRSHRHRHRTDRSDRPADDVRHRLRALDGLRSLPALTGSRGVRQDRRLSHRRRRRSRQDRTSDHRRRRHHGRRLRLLRVRGRPHRQTVRYRLRPGRPARRHHRPHAPRPGHDGTPRGPATGGCPPGSTGSSPSSTSTAPTTTPRPHIPSVHQPSNPNWPTHDPFSPRAGPWEVA